MSRRTYAYVLLLITTIIWGVAGPVIKYTVDRLPPLIFLSYRLGILAVLGLVWLPFIKRPGWPKSGLEWLNIVIYCVLAVPVALGLLFLGYQKTTALTGSILNAIYPLLVSAAGVMFLKEHVTKKEKWGMFVALLGTAVVIVEPFFNGAIHETSIEGNLLVIASILVNVVVVVMAKLIMRNKINAMALTHLAFIIGFISLIPITLNRYSLGEIYQLIVTSSWQVHAGVWYMALLSGTVAYYLWLIAQKTIEIGETAVFTYLYPVITLPLSIFWLHEPVTTFLIIGSIIISVGVVLAEVKTKKRSR